MEISNLPGSEINFRVYNYLSCVEFFSEEIVISQIFLYQSESQDVPFSQLIPPDLYNSNQGPFNYPDKKSGKLKNCDVQYRKTVNKRVRLYA